MTDKIPDDVMGDAATLCSIANIGGAIVNVVASAIMAERERHKADVERLLDNAKKDANLLRRYHAWCELNSCAPSTSDLYSLVLKEPPND